MIVTVTPNPSLDLTYRLTGEGGPAEVLRADSAVLEASGKGVNVSRTLLRSGVPSRCVLPLGGPLGAVLAGLLAADGVPADVVPQRGDTRVNTSILAGGGSTKVNAPGAPPAADETDALVAAVATALDDVVTAGAAVPARGEENWLAVCGSLPPGTDPALVARLVEVAHRAGVPVAVDSHGEPLAVAVRAGADLVAPNVAELAALDPTVAAAAGEERLVEAVAAFAERTGCQVLLSRGPDGAIWSDGRTTLTGRGSPVTPANPAGAGDALLAGWLSGPADPATRLARAVAWGTGCCLAPTTVTALGGEVTRQLEAAVRVLAHPLRAAR